MACGHFISVLVQVAVAVVCCIVLDVSLTSMPDFDVGSVWVGGTEIGNAH